MLSAPSSWFRGYRADACRARFAHSNRHIVFSSEVYVETEDRFIELRVPDRNAAIMSLVTEGQLLDVIPAKTYAAERHAIDDALELAAPLNSGGLAPAISGAWAALEALLTDSQDSDKKEGKVGAATHAARLVACSWPRAELTALSYRIDPERGTGRELSARLDVAETNRDRSQIIADQLRNTGQIPLLRTWRLPSDAAAVTRMNRLLANPTGMLTQVSDYVEDHCVVCTGVATSSSTEDQLGETSWTRRFEWLLRWSGRRSTASHMLISFSASNRSNWPPERMRP